MSIFNLFNSNDDDRVVTTLKSRGTNKYSIDITAGMIKQAVDPKQKLVVVDKDGYEHELLVYLRGKD
tara:strand:+ start:2937 stop:3137 length:201 start_codon:yes stop_codon:yes gene_type:complete